VRATPTAGDLGGQGGLYARRLKARRSGRSAPEVNRICRCEGVLLAYFMCWQFAGLYVVKVRALLLFSPVIRSWARRQGHGKVMK
jgi:hypothetical protein